MQQENRKKIIFYIDALKLQQEKLATLFTDTESFFVRNSSEYETSDNDRKLNHSIWPDIDTCDLMNNASSWP